MASANAVMLGMGMNPDDVFLMAILMAHRRGGMSPRPMSGMCIALLTCGTRRPRPSGWPHRPRSGSAVPFFLAQRAR
jgi:hypothetical protein